MGVPLKSGRVRLGRLVPGPAADGDVVPVGVTFPALAGALTKSPVASKEQMIPKVSFSMVPSRSMAALKTKIHLIHCWQNLK